MGVGDDGGTPAADKRAHEGARPLQKARADVHAIGVLDGYVDGQHIHGN